MNKTEVFDTVVGLAVMCGVAAAISGFVVFAVVYDAAERIDAKFRPK